MANSTIFGLISKYWIVGSILFLIGAGSGAILANVLEPVYRASTIVSVSTGSDSGVGSAELLQSVGGIAALAGINLAVGGGGKDEVLAYFRGRSFLTRFLISSEIIAELADAVDAVYAPDDMNNEKYFTPQDAYQYFTSRVLSVREDKRSGLISISIDWSDPALAAQWTNSLIDHANDSLRARANEEANESLKFLYDELEHMNIVELRQSLYGAIESQTRKKMLANVQEDYAFRVIDPAMPSDLDRPIRPRFVMSVVVGMVGGASLFMVFVSIVWLRSNGGSAIFNRASV